MAEKYLVSIDGEDVTFELERGDGVTMAVRREGAKTWRHAALERIGDSDLYLLLIDDEPSEIYLERRRGGAIVTIGRHAFDLDVQPWRPASARKAARGAGAGGVVRVTAPMTGSIVEVRCAPGDAVQQGDVLVVMESMKMNNELRATAAGRVVAVPAAAGQRVKAGDLLVSLQGEPDRVPGS